VNKKTIVLAAGLSVLVFGGGALAEFARNYVSIVGSGTLEPFATAIADQLGKSGKSTRAKVEATGTGGGIALFCEGVGADFPDIAIASRAFHKKELDSCRANGVNEIVELKIGYGGIVLAHAKKSKPMDLTRKDLYLALAKQVPDPACKADCSKLVPNPYQTWKQINPALPDTRIDVFGPPLNSGIRDAFAEMVLGAGCNSYPWLAAKKGKNESEYRKLCYGFREDGAYTEMMAEHDEGIVQRLVDKPQALGIDSHLLLTAHAGKLSAVAIDGVMPSPASIASQQYPVSRPLFVFVKKAHVGKIPGLAQYIAEFTSEKAWGEKGYLVAKGLIPMSPEERKTYAADAKNLTPMAMDAVSHHAR